ncbi:Phosphodiesterase/alkaline phosphatase D [Micromonospora nigra]|uniref:Phosphodiesterase/alkaline phosphatase D n=1 Tax=Micromonospora nigra TaxID=145857 RepID=A0A1C6SQP1_9ACTN|nr:alkaline phosphatase D family protein [Micromonospora nigra]SCL31914.1 Phosphodiesterase/alkaline phosphatase D [Micromonospora nigra]
MPVINAWVGAVTPSSAWVRARVSGVSSVRLIVADNAGFGSPAYYGPAVPTAEGVVSIAATGLAASTQYWWQLELDGAPDAPTGRVRTHPPLGEPATITFAAIGDAGLSPASPGVGAVLNSNKQSNHPAFANVDGHDPLFTAHLGDMHYYDLGSGNHGITGGASLANYRRGYDDVLLQPNQASLYRNRQLVYIWDDHDGGPADWDTTHANKSNAAQVYRERVPHYDLPESGAIYHSFQVGRVLFVATDSRYYRSPASDPDTSSKTMLGQAQKDWLAGQLADSDAELLVVLHQIRWAQHPAEGVQSWGGYSTERAELVEMFGDYGWLDRMLMLGADTHAMGIDTGASNLWGGFPMFLVAPVDATPSPSNLSQFYDLGYSATRGQYGLVTIADIGSQIDVTCAGYINSVRWRAHTFTVLTGSEPEPPPDPGGEPVPPQTPSSIADQVRWLGCDLVTGQVIAELPDVTGRVSRVLGAYTTTSLSIPIPVGGPAAIGAVAVEATQPGVTMVVAVVNDVPEWAGAVISRRGGTDGRLDLSCATLEAYLDRRYVGAHEWIQEDEAVIAAGLIADAQVDGIGLAVDAPLTGVLRDRTYTSDADATVYSRLRELMAVEGGPEWTIDLDWVDSTRTAVSKILRLRTRIGAEASKPPVWTSGWSSQGASDARYTLVEDYSDRRGANHVIATSSGEGDARPESTPAVDILAGWPRYEYRYTPSTSITDTDTLDAHAVAELALRRDGALTWQIDARWDAYPRLGVDWRLGDDVGWELRGHRHPDGTTGSGRVIGWELDMQAGRVRPVLWSPGGS